MHARLQNKTYVGEDGKLGFYIKSTRLIEKGKQFKLLNNQHYKDWVKKMEFNNFEDIPHELRRKAYDNALYAFGKSYIFEDRARRYLKRLTILKWLGICVPLLVYGLLSSFEYISTIQQIIFASATMGSTLLLILSAWSIVANWDLHYSQSILSQKDNSELYRSYKSLAETTIKDYGSYSSELSKLDLLLSKIEDRNIQLGITDSEKRMGMRAGLREFQRKCLGCNLVPIDLEPSECSVCGKFKRRRWI